MYEYGAPPSASAPPQQSFSYDSYAGAGATGNPFGSPSQGLQGPPVSPTPTVQTNVSQQSSSTYGQSQGMSGYGGYNAPSQPSNEMALVPSQQPSNPYAGMVTPSDPYGQHIVQAAQQNNQWAGQLQQQPAKSSAAASFDPFAPPPPAPAPPPAPLPPPQPVYVQPAPPPPQQNYAQQPSGPIQHDAMVPYGQAPTPAPAPPPRAPSPAPAPSPPPRDSHRDNAHLGYDAPEDEGPRMGNYRSYDYGQRPDSPNASSKREVASPGGETNPFREELARQAPPGASPLPKAHLVRKKGFVLSRISFRTIVMKKWKQSYWVQYGPHTMLWFRSEADFTDWLNNPYHDQAQRNFLIKLAVNFVHDLYKPNVRGYQVTQCRTKAYGNKMVRQFKLERWMDYGPTIAAAFGSYNPQEVDDLREALVECMRNTPLNSGIRATGAVRQSQESSPQRSVGHNRSAGTYAHEHAEFCNR